MVEEAGAGARELVQLALHSLEQVALHEARQVVWSAFEAHCPSQFAEQSTLQLPSQSKEPGVQVALQLASQLPLQLTFADALH